MAKTAFFLLVLVAVIALVSGESTTATLRRGDHNTPLAVIEENSAVEDVPSDRRQLWSWFSLLFLRKY